MSSSFTHKNIITLPNDHLRQRSQRITQIDTDTRQIISDMIAATLDWEAHRPNEVAVFDNKENKNFQVLINPEITKYEGEIITDYEGCLSVKDVYGKVPRYSKIRGRAIDINGNRIKIKSTDPFLSRVLQHEVDHTNGICFVDHISHNQDAFSVLTKSGDLVACPYSKVINSGIIADDEDNRTLR